MEAILEVEKVSLEKAKSLVSSLSWDEKRQLVAELLRQMIEEKAEPVTFDVQADKKIALTKDPKGMWSDLPPITKEMIDEARKEAWHAPRREYNDPGSR